ncbi:MAG TPA: phage tail tape measure protein [Pyrinomonadaceae bacterium]|jgi:TP901 family phage tail tape measure protein|nr:phage tail tape measure protein [Pyrinomonadaceae bacterium]
MASEAFTLAILLTLKDAASGGLDRFGARLRSTGKDGEKFASDFEKIRKNLNRDLAIGGLGVAGLKLLKNGIDTAADYQSVMTDLRATIAQTGKDGATDFNKLAQDMAGAEALAVKLGNALPGTTADFAEEMQVLKQNGLDLKTILGGAGEAFAHLAIANNALPKDIAAAGAEFGNLFKLKPDEFKPAADVMSRIFTSHGQTAEDLIEAAKYFQGRAGASLGITGLKSAEETSQLFGLMGMKGMKGSIAGTMLTDFFSEYQKHADKVKDLEKTTGIKLDFFDKKGSFAGFDTVFEQMKQFDKLSDKDRSSSLEDIFGLRGMSAANVFTSEGIEGWKKFKEQQQLVVNMEDKVAMKTTTFNNQMEALKGTLTNLEVGVFEQMLPGLTLAAKGANEIAGTLQQFTKNHPDLLKYAVEFLAMGSLAMTAYSGLSMLITGVRMFKLVSQFSRGEGLVANLAAVNSAIPTATRNVAGFTSQIVTAEKKVGGLKGALSNLGGSQTIRVGLQIASIVGLEAMIAKSIENYEAGAERARVAQVTRDQQFRDYSGGWKLGPGDPKAKTQTAATINRGKEIFDDFNQLQNELTEALNGGPSLQKRLGWRNLVPDNIYAEGIDRFGKMTGLGSWEDLWGNRSSPGWLGNKQRVGNQFTSGASGLFSVDQTAAVMAKNRALSDPSAMAGFLFNIRKNLPKDQASLLEQSAQKAFPKEQVYEKALPLLQALEVAAKAQQQNTANTALFQQQSQSFVESLSSLQQPMAGTAELFSGLPTTIQPPVDQMITSFTDMYPPASKLPGALNNIFVSADGVARGLQSVSEQLLSWRPPATPSVPFGSPPPPGIENPLFGGPANAVGGVIERDGWAYVHAGNTITPAKKRAYKEPGHGLLSDLTNEVESLRSADRQTAGPGRPTTISVNYSPSVVIHGADDKAKAEFAQMLEDHSRIFERKLAKVIKRAEVRA